MNFWEWGPITVESTPGLEDHVDTQPLRRPSVYKLQGNFSNALASSFHFIRDVSQHNKKQEAYLE